MNAFVQFAQRLKSCSSVLSPLSRLSRVQVNRGQLWPALQCYATNIPRPKQSLLFSTQGGLLDWMTLPPPLPPLSLLAMNNIGNHQVRFRSSRSREGLYDGKDVRFGNKRSHSMRKTRRKFKPNVHRKRLYSEVLDQMIQFNKVSTSALRSIDRCGGLDKYILTSKHVWEGQGQKLKKRLLIALKWKEKEKKWAEQARLKAEEEAKNQSTASDDAASNVSSENARTITQKE